MVLCRKDDAECENAVIGYSEADLNRSNAPMLVSPKAMNDFRIGGKFVTRMEAKKGSFRFDFEGIYMEVIDYKYLGKLQKI